MNKSISLLLPCFLKFLQCENVIISPSALRKTAVDVDERETHEDDEEDEEHYMITKTKELTKHVIITWRDDAFYNKFQNKLLSGSD